MFILTSREEQTVTHALRIAGERFRENAATMRAESADPQAITREAAERLALEFDSYVERGAELLRKIEAKGEIALEGTVALYLSPEQITLLDEALDSRAYWQLSDSHYRNDGEIIEPGSDDPETQHALADVHVLRAHLAEQRT